jgi:hypothetical protein
MNLMLATQIARSCYPSNFYRNRQKGEALEERAEFADDSSPSRRASVGRCFVRSKCYSKDGQHGTNLVSCTLLLRADRNIPACQNARACLAFLLHRPDELVDEKTNKLGEPDPVEQSQRLGEICGKSHIGVMASTRSTAISTWSTSNYRTLELDGRK